MPPRVYFMASNGVDDVSCLTLLAGDDVDVEERGGGGGEVGLPDWTLAWRLLQTRRRLESKQTCSRTTRSIHFPIGKQPSLLSVRVKQSRNPNINSSIYDTTLQPYRARDSRK